MPLSRSIPYEFGRERRHYKPDYELINLLLLINKLINLLYKLFKLLYKELIFTLFITGKIF